MATVESWFWAFVERHIDRVPRADWPDLASEFWETHKAAFVKHGVTEAVADEASRLMAEAGSVFPDAHLRTFLESVKTAWALDRLSIHAETGTRDSARAASRECPMGCGGEGLVTRYRRQSAVPGRNNGVVMYCTCASGRWIENAHRTGDESSRDAHRRIPDLMDFPRLQAAEFNLPPTFADDGRPRDAGHDAMRPSPRALAAIGAATPEDAPIF